MYYAYWGLRKNPFGLSPDPDFLYRSKQHEEALANLIRGVESREGLLVLTGEVGTGKTLLLECLQNFLGSQDIEFACLLNSRITVDQFFEMIAYDLELPGRKNSKDAVWGAFNDCLMKQAAQGKTTVLIVDEAQNLGEEVLEEIRLLDDLEGPRGKLLQIVLAGQPEFDAALNAPKLRQLKQKIAMRCTLRAFSRAETGEYIAKRLEEAGLPDQTILSPDLLAGIHACSHGVPRLINGICDNLLLAGFVMRARAVTLEMLAEVARDMRLQWQPFHQALTPEKTQAAAAAAAAAPAPAPLPEVLVRPRTEVHLPAAPIQIPPPPPPILAAPVQIREKPVFEAVSRSETLPVRRWVGPATLVATKPRRKHSAMVWLIPLTAIALVLSLRLVWEDPGATPAPTPFDHSAAVVPPHALRIVPAKYTAAARYAGFRGKVFAVVTVNPQGAVTRVEFPLPMAFDLDTSVRRVVPSWRFTPATRGGNPVEGRSLVEVPFQ